MDIYEKLLRQAESLEKLVMYSKIAGITFDNRQYYARRCYPGMRLTLRRNPNNPYDINAVEVRTYDGLTQLGFIPKETAVTIARLMDTGHKLGCYVEQINDSGAGVLGVNIKIVEA